MLDFLTETFAGAGVSRDGRAFVTTKPWAIARFGSHVLQRGWWIFECEGEGDVSGVEVRLVSPEDALIAFSLRRAEDGRAMFPADRAFSVSVMISGWPGRVKLSTLRLRRMTKSEQAQMAMAMIVRLVRSEKPLAKLAHVASRAFGGRSLRVQTPAAHDSWRSSAPAKANSRGFLAREQDGVTTVLQGGDQLHPRAMEIVSAAFASSKQLQALYADVDAGGVIRPRPEWDFDLAAAGGFTGSPVFFRGVAEPVNPWPRVGVLASQPGAVARIALPLAISEASPEPFTTPPVPTLSRTPSVSVVVPTRTRSDLLKRCLLGLAESTDYPDLEVIVVDNGADPEALADAVAAVGAKLTVTRVEGFGPFNFSWLVNLGVRNSMGEIIVLLNDDVEAVEKDWLRRVIESVMRPDVGCVGVRLLYADRRIQHAGVTLGVSGVCGHLWKGADENAARKVPQVVLPSGRMAVTGACLAVRRETFEQAGGLDDKDFPVAFNDIDFCLRVRAMGLRTIYRGDAMLIHHESQSRGSDDATLERRKRLARETAAFLTRWGDLLLDDPFGSPAFDPTTETGAIHPSLHEFQHSRE